RFCFCSCSCSSSVNVIFRNQAGNIQSLDLTGITNDKWFDSSYNSVLSVYSKEISTNDFILYPNPTYGTLKVESREKISEAGVFDLKGTLVSFQSIGNNQLIELGNLISGTYIIKMITEKRQTIYKKIIKK
ncbi:MAG TPA: T9SS type A sorting domain-containing protein, partial [Flavobacterium alvei]|nr:T9SS type A sorting domain-containing protein [Flavobacterium alvei]